MASPSLATVFSLLLLDSLYNTPVSQLVNLTHQLGTTPALAQAGYTYDGVGNRLTLTDLLKSGDTIPNAA